MNRRISFVFAVCLVVLGGCDAGDNGGPDPTWEAPLQAEALPASIVTDVAAITESEAAAIQKTVECLRAAAILSYTADVMLDNIGTSEASANAVDLEERVVRFEDCMDTLDFCQLPN